MLPVLKILNKNLVLEALVDDYESFYFEQYYNDIGECKLKISVFSNGYKAIEKNKYIYVSEFECWFIEEVEIEKDIATITGLSLNFILGHRITLPLPNKSHLTYKDKLTGDIVKDLVNRCLISSSIKNRNIPMTLKSGSVGHKVNFKSRYANLLEDVQELCEYSALGFRIGININTKKFIFEVYQGKDVSKNILFSEDYDNITDLELVDSNISMKNHVYVLGEGEGKDRTMVEVDDEGLSGFLRREELEEASTTYDSDDEPTEAEKIADLERAGDTILAENRVKTSCEATILPTVNYNFGVDYALGDVVTIVSKKYNYMVSQRIIGYTWEYTIDGKTFDVIIGVLKPSLKLKDDSKDIK